jgi:hypothetical protein
MDLIYILLAKMPVRCTGYIPSCPNIIAAPMTITSHVELKTCVRGATTNYNEPTLCTDREHLPDDLSITTRGRFGDGR